jgi:DNA-binding IclR family transcriptional regulator
MDAPGDGEGWPVEFMKLIEARPATRAGDLARHVGLERAEFKRRVRRLKALGLTESLKIGYRLSPRGAAVLAAMRR